MAKVSDAYRCLLPRRKKDITLACLTAACRYADVLWVAGTHQPTLLRVAREKQKVR